MKKESVLISVVIPCYNAEKFIKETIMSVLNQSYHHFEIIVVDDGSTDSSAQIINSLKDDRIHYVFQSNSGVATARNQGITRAKGEYIAFLDADDLYLPTNLEKKVTALMQNTEYGLVHSAEQKFDSLTNKEISIVYGQGGIVLEKLLSFSENIIHSPSSVLVSKKRLLELDGFDENLSTSADWDMWVRLAYKTPFLYLEDVLVKYRVHPEQMHLNIDKMNQDMLYAFQKNYKNGIFKNKQFYKKCLANMYLTLSACYLGDAKNISKFLIFFMKSVLTHPHPFVKRIRKRLFSKN